MVEGPKVAIKSRKLKGLEEQRLQRAFGTVGDLTLLIMKVVSRVFCVGKELFIVFGRVAIRLHFGMNGTEVLLRDVPPTDSLDSVIRKYTTGRKKFSGALQFETDTLLLYDSTIQLRYGMDLDICEGRLIRDVMSPSFSVESVLEYLCVDERKIMDALMDQMILPGVGNIIKCEGLFLSSINPNITTRDIPMQTLVALLKYVQEFSRRWHACCISRRQVDKAVYGRDACSRCEGRISLIRDGREQRITYFCPVCQHGVPPTVLSRTEDLHQTSVSVKTAPKTALSLWLTSDRAKRDMRVADIETESSEGTKMVKALLPVEQENHHPQFSNSSHVTNSPYQLAVSSSAEAALDGMATVTTAVSATDHACASLFFFFRQPLCSCSVPAAGKKQSTGTVTAAVALPGAAKTSGRAALLQRVRKDGPNHGRLFWTCPRVRPVPVAAAVTGTAKASSYSHAGKAGGSGCGLFLWADDQFPLCSCHCGNLNVSTTMIRSTDEARRTVLRRVLKPGINNGRYFFSCRQTSTGGTGSKGSGCGFFHWADEWSKQLLIKKGGTANSAIVTSTIASELSSFTVPL